MFSVENVNLHKWRNHGITLNCEQIVNFYEIAVNTRTNELDLVIKMVYTVEKF